MRARSCVRSCVRVRAPGGARSCVRVRADALVILIVCSYLFLLELATSRGNRSGVRSYVSGVRADFFSCSITLACSICVLHFLACARSLWWLLILALVFACVLVLVFTLAFECTLLVVLALVSRAC